MFTELRYSIESHIQPTQTLPYYYKLQFSPEVLPIDMKCWDQTIQCLSHFINPKSAVDLHIRLLVLLYDMPDRVMVWKEKASVIITLNKSMPVHYA
jgi:hypothetical protein